MMRAPLLLALIVLGCRERDEPPRQVTLALTGPSQPDPLAGVERLRFIAHADSEDLEQDIALSGGNLILDTLVPIDTRYLTVLGLGPGGERLAAGASSEIELVSDGQEVSLVVARLGEVSTVPSALVTPRAGHCSVALAPADVVLLGGSTQGGNPTNTTERFDASSGSSTLGPTLPFSPDQCARADEARVLATDAGTSSNLLLVDFAAGTTRQVAGCGVARTGSALVALPNHRFAVVGGADGAAAPLAEAQVVELTGDSTSCVGFVPLEVARSLPEATSLADGRVLVAGGEDAVGAAIARVELIDTRELSHVFAMNGPAATEIVLAGIAAGSVLQLYSDAAGEPAAGLWLIGEDALVFRDLPGAPATWSAQRAVHASAGIWISGGAPSRLERFSRLTFEELGDMRALQSGHTFDGAGFGALAAIGGTTADGTTLATAEWFQGLPATPYSRPDISRGFDDEVWWRGWEMHDPTLWTLREGDPGFRFALGILGQAGVNREGLDELAVLGQTIAPPFVMEIDVAALGAGASAAVVARYCDAANYVYLAFDTAGTQITAHAIESGVRTTLAAGFALSRTGLVNYRHITIRDHGDALSVDIDTDTITVQPPAMICRHARVGFGADAPTDGAIFDNVRIERSFE